MKIDLNNSLSSQPAYRLKQVEKAWFDVNIKGYGEITTLPKDLREQLKNIPWLAVKEKVVQTSQVDDTCKALLELADGNTIETVLMGREDKRVNAEKEKRYTICVSTQVGCPMNCSFCATGQMGFKRNLTTEEIIDQYRFWQKYLASPPFKEGAGGGLRKNDRPHPTLHLKMEGNSISNIVLMGQGEPLLNYNNVKQALDILLNNTDIGPRKITLSTVGVMPAMEKMLTDKDFPPVRLAISLHSAIEKTRAKIIPSHQKGFLDFLIDWSKKYHQTFPSRTHFIGLEYTLLPGINDTDTELKSLKKFASKLGHIRLNLISYNSPSFTPIIHNTNPIIQNTNPIIQNTNPIIQNTNPIIQNHKSEIRNPKLECWRDELMKSGFTVTIRHSHGQDIAAACGQLQNSIQINK